MTSTAEGQHACLSDLTPSSSEAVREKASNNTPKVWGFLEIPARSWREGSKVRSCLCSQSKEIWDIVYLWSESARPLLSEAKRISQSYWSLRLSKMWTICLGSVYTPGTEETCVEDARLERIWNGFLSLVPKVPIPARLHWSLTEIYAVTDLWS